MLKNLKLWYIRKFKVITIEKANSLNLKHFKNVYGDEINHIRCRSLWVDNKNRLYRVSNLV